MKNNDLNRPFANNEDCLEVLRGQDYFLYRIFLYDNWHTLAHFNDKILESCQNGKKEINIGITECSGNQKFYIRAFESQGFLVSVDGNVINIKVNE